MHIRIHKTRTMDKKERVLSMIREINRPGTEILIDYINTTNYFTTAKCYSHHKYEGGLLDHSLEVLDAMMKNNYAGLSTESITVAALFHDLGKATVDGRKFSSSYHPIRSLQILNHCGYELTQEEADAISGHHDRKYTKSLRTLLRKADGISCKVSKSKQKYIFGALKMDY